jgi:hypothetical protein
MSSSELEQILQSVREFKTEIKTEMKESEARLEAKLGESEARLEAKLGESEARLEAKIDGFNEKFDNYQKATQWVVQLSFSLIASATVVTVISSVFRR